MFSRCALFLLVFSSFSFAIDPDHDFSGKWILAQGARLSVPFEDTLSIEQTDTEIRCSAGGVQWTYALNGTERKVQINGETRNSRVKWEGAALLINTIVTGPHDFVVMDRWRLSRDHATLTVTRQIIRGVKQEEGFMSYRRDRPAPPPPPVSDPEPAPREVAPPRAVAPPPPAPVPPPPTRTLVRREEPEPFEATIPAGTHIPLSFRNTIDTAHSHEGDRIYLQTAFPVARDGHVVIPRGSFVNGVITRVKQPGRSSKGELSIRFDTLQLPNGVMRDFRSRPAGGEGGVSPDTVGGAKPAQVGRAAGTGATVGAMSGGPMGAGIGGVAAGIASVLFSHGVNATLPQGTTVDMVLDRDLHFRSEDLQ